MACPVRGDRTAVGSFVDKATGAEHTLAEQWNGSGWVIQATPTLTGQGGLAGVSCLSATDCTAFGTQTGQQAGHRPLIEHWDGTNWTVQHVPLPAGAWAADLDGGVSCSSATLCTAVGAYGPKSQPGALPFVARWNGTGWTAHTAPLPAGATGGFLNSVSCTSPSRCTAMGGYDNAAGTAVPPFAIRWNGTTWTIQALNAPDEGSLAAVSCPSATSCTAVGGLSNTGLAEHWDGINWAVQPTPVPKHGTATSATLLGVSCLSGTYCTAVGYYNRAQPLADHE